MSTQQATWDDLWNLNEEELEELLAADENLIDLPQETKKVDSSVFEKALSQRRQGEEKQGALCKSLIRPEGINLERSMIRKNRFWVHLFEQVKRRDQHL